MNFNLILLLLISIMFSSCGVKAPPLKPTETVIDSYISNYTNEETLEPKESIQIPVPSLDKK